MMETAVENNEFEKVNIVSGAQSEGNTALIMPYDYKEDEYYVIELPKNLKEKPAYDFLKRAFDIVASFIALIILTIPMLVIAGIIKVTSPGPVLYKQERLGLNGLKFNILKFRSMYVDAEKAGARWSDGDNDERITPFGHILRNFRLDELPQLLCVLKGTMSLIGPRPERECFYDIFEKHVLGFSNRLAVKPGITGLAQVCGGYDLAPHEKAKYDMEYIGKRSILFDIKIMLKTVVVIFTHDGAK